MSLLSVIIPTHNRAQYAVQSIRSILELSPDIQVVVCDSSPVDDISGHFVDYSATRLKLVRTGQGISVVDNFNLGLEAAEGEYLVFIGDDDFVGKEVVQVAEWARNKKIDSVKFNFPALYYWNDFKHSTQGNAYSATLHINAFDGSVTPHDLKASMRHALDNFGGGVFDMPRAYAGMISADLARKIKLKYGQVFGGVSPDIYSSFLIANESNGCVLIDYPVIIPGASGMSTSGQSSSGGHYGKLRDNAHIAPFKNLIWDDRIPEFYSVPTVWSYSLLKAIEKVEAAEGVDLQPNFGRALVKCFVYFPRSYKETFSSFRQTAARYGYAKIIAQIIQSVWAESVWVLSRVSTKLFKSKMTTDGSVLKGLETTYSASKGLQQFLTECPIKLKLSA